MRYYTKIVVFGLSCSMLMSCINSRKLEGYHDGILPRDSMVMLLLDIQLVESYRNLKYIQGNADTDEKIRVYYEEIFARYGISAERFDSSYSYYQYQDPVILDAMYAEVNTRLNELLSQQP